MSVDVFVASHGSFYDLPTKHEKLLHRMEGGPNPFIDHAGFLAYIDIFDQEGNFLAQWTQFGRPSGIFFDDHDRIFVADSESDDVQNPGWEMGIRIGDALTGWVTEFILFPGGDPRETAGNGAEFVAVDRYGNMYGGEPRPRNLQRYVRVRP